MRVSGAEIAQFRSIKNLTLDFAIPCQVLLGINETGKTNILKALSLLAPSSASSQNDIRQVPSHEAEPTGSHVTFSFTVSNDDRDTFIEAATSRTLHLDQPSPLGASLRDLFERLFMPLRYKVDIADGTRAILRKQNKVPIHGKWMAPSGECPPDFTLPMGIRGRQPLKDFALVAEDFAAQRGIPAPYLREATIADTNGLIDRTIHQWFEAHRPECVYWTYSRDNILPSSIELNELLGKEKERNAVLHNLFRLAEISDIAAAVSNAQKRQNGMQTLFERIGHRATAHIRTRWNDFKDLALEFRENGPHVQCTIRDVHGSFDFDRRSDGFRRFVGFLLAVSTRATSGDLDDALLLYDEPDTSLHPSGARQLRSELAKMADRNVVVYSTHSIFMVDPQEVERHLIVTKRGEETTIDRATSGTFFDEEVLFQAIGYSVFEFIGLKNVIFEGHRDKLLFETALSIAPQESKGLFHKVGRCHTQGVKNMNKLTPLLQLAGRDCLIVSDADQPALERQKEYRGHGTWCTYAEVVGPSFVTAEDFFTSETVDQAIRKVATTHVELSHILSGFQASDGAVLQKLDAHMSQRGASKDTRKETLAKIKEALFGAPSPSELRQEASGLVAALAKRLFGE
jgi:hypothetical protein